MAYFLRMLSSRIFWFSLFLVVLFCIAFYLVMGREYESAISRQILSKQQVVTRAEASNTISYLQSFGNSVAVLARLSSIENGGKNAAIDLDIFVEQRHDDGILGGVALIDKNGVVQLNSNVMGSRDVGKSLADRNFFIWSRNEGKKGQFYISEPIISRLGASQGQTIVVVASPIYQNNTFKGVVAASVILDTLVERFFGLMKISDSTKTYLVNPNGEILYSSSSDDNVGTKVSELFSNEQLLDNNIQNALRENQEGQFQSEDRLVAYTPISLSTQNWLLIISSPSNEIAELARPLYIRQAAILILAIFTLLFYWLVIFRRNQS